MSRFNQFFLMKTTDVAEYVEYKLGFFAKGAQLECAEIGDGNLNYVFRLRDIKSGKSIIVKQAGPTLRISKEMKASTDRGRIEADILELQGRLAPGMVPKVYLYDEVMCAICMEDMVGHSMMRTALLEHQTFPLFADQISTFLANTLLYTSDIVMEPKQKKLLVKSFINPDLCKITEELVYTEPYNDYNAQNVLFPETEQFIINEVYSDADLHLEVAKLKLDFLSNAQALIHGDLHTGSIFINQEHIFVFDPEFAFFGPIGYDLGNIIANLFFAWCNGKSTIEDEIQKNVFCNWVLDCIEQIVDKFTEKFVLGYRENAIDLMTRNDDFMHYYIKNILADAAGVAGLESIRRIVGIAKVKDITSIANIEKRAKAEKTVVLLAKQLIMERDNFQCGQDYIEAIFSIV